LLVANAIDFVGVFSDFSNPILIGFDVRAVMLLPLTKRDPIVLVPALHQYLCNVNLMKPLLKMLVFISVSHRVVGGLADLVKADYSGQGGSRTRKITTR